MRFRRIDIDKTLIRRDPAGTHRWLKIDSTLIQRHGMESTLNLCWVNNVCLLGRGLLWRQWFFCCWLIDHRFFHCLKGFVLRIWPMLCCREFVSFISLEKRELVAMCTVIVFLDHAIQLAPLMSDYCRWWQIQHYKSHDWVDYNFRFKKLGKNPSGIL